MNMRRSLVSRSNTAKLRQRYKTHKEYDRLMSVDLDAILDTVSTTFSIPPFQNFIPIDGLLTLFVPFYIQLKLKKTTIFPTKTLPTPVN